MEDVKTFQNVSEVRWSYDPDDFKRMKGNRSVEESRVKKILDSIGKVGFVPSPLVVNEKMEIIDGQGRAEACKRLGIPVPYVIVPGAGLTECVAMNISGTKWGKLDYIRSYADTGNEDYERLVCLIEGHDLSITTVLTASMGMVSMAKGAIESGEFKMSWERAEHVDDVLTYIERFTSFSKGKRIPNMQKLCEALCFLYELGAIDNERMYVAFTRYYAELGGYSTTEQALGALEHVYNKKLAARNRVYVTGEYKAYMAERLPWYESRYGSGRK